MDLREKLLARFKLVRLGRVAVVVFLLLILLDIGIRHVESIPGLMLRNEGQTHIAIPYMFRQMELTRDRPVIAFFGASVMQGVLNNTPETTIPMQVQRTLDEHEVAARCFNMAAIGNNLGDNLALAYEASKRGADLLVFNLHYKLFSNKGSLNFMVCHRNTIFYLRRHPDFLHIRTQIAMMPRREFLDIRLEKGMENVWAFYRERRLIAYCLTGDIEPLPAQMRKWIIQAGKTKPQTALDLLGTPEERNVNNLWQQQPEHYHQSNTEAYKQITLDLENRHFQTLQLINELSAITDAKVLFYLTPHNRVGNNTHQYFAWEDLAEFATMTREMAEAHGNYWFDMTDAVDSRHFTDCDHININGAAQLAQALAEPITQALAGEQQ